MYNETSYEEYMRSVLGYRPNFDTQNLYSTNDYYIMPNNIKVQNNQCEELYPEIYYRVYPLVCQECQQNNVQLTQETLEAMTDKIYKAIEIDLKIETKNVRQDDRQVNSRNNFLRDLIKVLILREIIGGGNAGPRPPRPPQGPRPPFPGGPGQGPRPTQPPIRPRPM